MENELWKPVIGYENIYEISNLGRVRRAVNGLIKRARNRKGYLCVNLTRERCEKTFSVHVLVCAAFLGVRPNGYDINHKNLIKTDNRLENLEYVTKKENSQHLLKNGRKIGAAGEKHWNCKLTPEAVQEIRRRVKSGETKKAVAASYGLPPSTVSYVCNYGWREIKN